MQFAVLLHWHLVVERGDVKGAQSALYGQALKLLAERLSAELNRCTAMQTSTMRRLVEVVQSVANSKRDRLEKIDRLRFLLSGSVGDPLRTIDPPVLFPIAPYLKARRLSRSRVSNRAHTFVADVGHCCRDGDALQERSAAVGARVARRADRVGPVDVRCTVCMGLTHRSRAVKARSA